MAKKMGRPSLDRNDVQVRIPKHLATKARAIADDRGVPAAQVLEEILTVPLNRAYGELLQKLNGPTDPPQS